MRTRLLGILASLALLGTPAAGFAYPIELKQPIYPAPKNWGIPILKPSGKIQKAPRTIPVSPAMVQAARIQQLQANNAALSAEVMCQRENLLALQDAFVHHRHWYPAFAGYAIGLTYRYSLAPRTIGRLFRLNDQGVLLD